MDSENLYLVTRLYDGRYVTHVVDPSKPFFPYFEPYHQPKVLHSLDHTPESWRVHVMAPNPARAIVSGRAMIEAERR